MWLLCHPTSLLLGASWLRRNWLLTSVLLSSVFTLCFWQFRYTESPLLRRVFSVGNVNDFSWRNRVTAWQGAGRMMLDKPLAGFGWGTAEEAYRKEYRAARLEETAAIQLNDYLMLGISAGVPALLCFITYMTFVGYQGSRARPSPFGFRASGFGLQPVCAAGATVLLIGFWFDGGLFKLPACVVFWILLELARCGSRDCEAQSSGAWKEESSWAQREGLTAKYTKHTKTETALNWLAALVAVLAIGQTALYLGLPQFAASPRSIAFAHSWLVPPREKLDFEFLTAQSDWSGNPLGVLLQHVHLASYNRELANWKVDDSIYQQFVLSPEIDPVFDGDMNWRRPVWEYFYPRIRKETSLTGAAETVMRHLRERVKVAPAEDSRKSIAEMWQDERADDRGFEAVCVAALRSVGIPAQLSILGQVEFWNGTEWKSASGNPPP